MNLDEIFKKLDLYESDEIQSIEKTKESLRIKFFALRKCESDLSNQMKYLSLQWGIKTGCQRLNLMRVYVKLLNQLKTIENRAKNEDVNLQKLRNEWKKCKFEIKEFEANCPAIAREVNKYA